MDEVLEQLFPKDESIQALLSPEQLRELNDAVEARWAQARGRKRKVVAPARENRTIHFDDHEPGLGGSVVLSGPHQGFNFGPVQFRTHGSGSIPGLLALRAEADPARLKIGYSNYIPVSGRGGDIIEITREGGSAFHIQNLHIAPGNYDNVTFDFKAFDEFDSEIATYSELINADYPAVVVLPQPDFEYIHKFTITVNPVTTPSLHIGAVGTNAPDPVTTYMYISIVNINVSWDV